MIKGQILKLSYLINPLKQSYIQQCDYWTEIYQEFPRKIAQSFFFNIWNECTIPHYQSLARKLMVLACKSGWDEGTVSCSMDEDKDYLTQMCHRMT